ncbi:Inositol 2-dehydrogenase [Pirellulimonas nuda]|uniref:Inositol 2-dehydrogenase n=1 Tax=Pirellulimonas nuda TaxID=2528009 RepID=A0A518D5T5_9BACT|nr:Gfo/Idh/MocA family oxidoreductase [Pirellulimonas nuda]QDU86835.1 Inositol 2-dehydrogenase [Pirellulimonas nuda]
MPKSIDRSNSTGASRRQFLQTGAAAGVGYWVAGGLRAAESSSPNEQVQVAGIGIGGKGKSDLMNASEHAKVVAVCDVDQGFLTGALSEYGIDKGFADYRELFDQMGDQIDAVTVSTPDHTHALIAAEAMRRGINVYCQKPMTRTIYEARRLGEIARKSGVVTQMGNQYTAYNPMRKAAYQLRAGMLGDVSQVHVWTNRPVWPQGEKRPAPAPVPTGLDWASWIGPAPMRDYGAGYHPFKWRGWWDFGTGALGDMACHTCNLPFMGLNMRDPVSVEAETAPNDHDSYPVWSRIKFEFPAGPGWDGKTRAPFTLHWYDGGQKPDNDLFAGVTLTTGGDKKTPPPSPSGVMIIGDKGRMYAAGDYADLGIQILEADEIKVDYPKARGGGDSAHNREFFDAIKDRSKTTTSNFPDYATPLTETILLGNLAVWKGGLVKWDAKNLTPDDPALMKIVKPEYHNGYELI